MTTSPYDLLSEQAATLVRFAALPSLLLTREEQAAFLAGAKALEREARQREHDRKEPR